jgi:hypothetical protein
MSGIAELLHTELLHELPGSAGDRDGLLAVAVGFVLDEGDLAAGEGLDLDELEESADFDGLG